MLTTNHTRQFKRDVKRCEKRGKDMAKMKVLIDLLENQIPLPKSYSDHPLKGKWKSSRDAHIESNWLLIYEVRDGVLFLQRTGTHSDITE